MERTCGGNNISRNDLFILALEIIKNYKELHRTKKRRRKHIN
jgi:hypothetical protein